MYVIVQCLFQLFASSIDDGMVINPRQVLIYHVVERTDSRSLDPLPLLVQALFRPIGLVRAFYLQVVRYLSEGSAGQPTRMIHIYIFSRVRIFCLQLVCCLSRVPGFASLPDWLLYILKDFLLAGGPVFISLARFCQGTC